ncbi:MAG: helix-turn-helix transcriptional regulator [Bacteroides caccae]|nr:helix-turn-helix transcriptional regulator [Bacteroides caccae]
MKLLYLSEHHSCFNYGIKIDSGFTQYRLVAQESGQIDNSCCFCILFFLKGELSVNIGREHNIHLLEHNMLLIPQHEENRVEGIVSAECLLLFWNKQITACDKMYFESISHVKMENGNNCILPIRKPLLHILRQLLFYLDTGLLCRHMHILKQQEIILALRGFYTKSELAAFFSRTTGVGRQFEDFVLDNYKNVKTVKEFASLCCVSERSFNRKFQESFSQSPYRWMQERRAGSPAHLTCYCKKLFGATPTELRNNYNKGNET